MTSQEFLDLETLEAKTHFLENLVSNQNDFHHSFVRFLANKDKQLYCYLVTFTLSVGCMPTFPSPKYLTKNEYYQEVEDYIEKQFKRKPLKITEAHMVREYTKKGIPHWHVAVSCEKHLAKNRFNYYSRKYGNVDISKSKCQNIQESLNYINKSSVSRNLTHTGGR